MKKAVWKFPLEVDDVQRIEMPEGADLLTVQTQQDEPCLWALVDPYAPTALRTILTAGTGHLRTDLWYLNYVGSYQLLDEQFVGHVFDGGWVPEFKR